MVLKTSEWTNMFKLMKKNYLAVCVCVCVLKVFH